MKTPRCSWGGCGPGMLPPVADAKEALTARGRSDVPAQASESRSQPPTEAQRRKIALSARGEWFFMPARIAHRGCETRGCQHETDPTMAWVARPNMVSMLLRSAVKPFYKERRSAASSPWHIYRKKCSGQRPTDGTKTTGHICSANMAAYRKRDTVRHRTTAPSRCTNGTSILRTPESRTHAMQKRGSSWINNQRFAGFREERRMRFPVSHAGSKDGRE